MFRIFRPKPQRHEPTPMDSKPQITINWERFNLYYGDPITAKNLNATVSPPNTPGYFSYSITQGDLLPVGPNTVTATFHMASHEDAGSESDAFSLVSGLSDETEYPLSIVVTIRQAKVNLKWIQPRNLKFGESITKDHYNVKPSLNIPGDLTYNPPIGYCVYTPGKLVLECTFTPHDQKNYGVTANKKEITVERPDLIDMKDTKLSAMNMVNSSDKHLLLIQCLINEGQLQLFENQRSEIVNDLRTEIDELRQALQIENRASAVVLDLLRNLRAKIVDELSGEDLSAIERKFKEIFRMLCPFDIRETLIMVREGMKSVLEVEGKDILLFFGGTGAGKSTIINAFGGARFFVGDDNKLILDEDSLSPLLRRKNVKIGNTAESQTRYINAIPIMVGANEISLTDSAGIGDTHGPEVDFASGISLIKAVNACRTVRLAICMSFIVDPKYTTVAKLMRTLGSILPDNIGDYVDYLNFIITRFNGPKEKQDKLMEEYNRMVNTLKCPNDSQEEIKLAYLRSYSNMRVPIADPTNPQLLSDILNEFCRRRPISNPKEVFRYFFSAESESALKLQLNIIMTIVESGLESNTAEGYQLINYKLNELQELGDILSDQDEGSSYHVINAIQICQNKIELFFFKLHKFAVEPLRKAMETGNNLTVHDLNAYLEHMERFRNASTYLQERLLTSKTIRYSALEQELVSLVKQVSENLIPSSEIASVELAKIHLIDSHMSPKLNDFKSELWILTKEVYAKCKLALEASCNAAKLKCKNACIRFDELVITKEAVQEGNILIDEWNIFAKEYDTVVRIKELLDSAPAIDEEIQQTPFDITVDLHAKFSDLVGKYLTQLLSGSLSLNQKSFGDKDYIKVGRALLLIDSLDDGSLKGYHFIAEFHSKQRKAAVEEVARFFDNLLSSCKNAVLNGNYELVSPLLDQMDLIKSLPNVTTVAINNSTIMDKFSSFQRILIDKVQEIVEAANTTLLELTSTNIVPPTPEFKPSFEPYSMVRSTSSGDNRFAPLGKILEGLEYAKDWTNIVPIDTLESLQSRLKRNLKSYLRTCSSKLLRTNLQKLSNANKLSLANAYLKDLNNLADALQVTENQSTAVGTLNSVSSSADSSDESRSMVSIGSIFQIELFKINNEVSSLVKQALQSIETDVKFKVESKDNFGKSIDFNLVEISLVYIQQCRFNFNEIGIHEQSLVGNGYESVESMALRMQNHCSDVLDAFKKNIHQALNDAISVISTGDTMSTPSNFSDQVGILLNVKQVAATELKIESHPLLVKLFESSGEKSIKDLIQQFVSVQIGRYNSLQTEAVALQKDFSQLLTQIWILNPLDEQFLAMHTSFLSQLRKYMGERKQNIIDFINNGLYIELYGALRNVSNVEEKQIYMDMLVVSLARVKQDIISNESKLMRNISQSIDLINPILLKLQNLVYVLQSFSSDEKILSLGLQPFVIKIIKSLMKKIFTEMDRGIEKLREFQLAEANQIIIALNSFIDDPLIHSLLLEPLLECDSLLSELNAKFQELQHHADSAIGELLSHYDFTSADNLTIQQKVQQIIDAYSPKFYYELLGEDLRKRVVKVSHGGMNLISLPLWEAISIKILGRVDELFKINGDSPLTQFDYEKQLCESLINVSTDDIAAKIRTKLDKHEETIGKLMKTELENLVKLENISANENNIDLLAEKWNTYSKIPNCHVDLINSLQKTIQSKSSTMLTNLTIIFQSNSSNFKDYIVPLYEYQRCLSLFPANVINPTNDNSFTRYKNKLSEMVAQACEVLCNEFKNTSKIDLLTFGLNLIQTATLSYQPIYHSLYQSLNIEYQTEGQNGNDPISEVIKELYKIIIQNIREIDSLYYDNLKSIGSNSINLNKAIDILYSHDSLLSSFQSYLKKSSAIANAYISRNDFEYIGITSIINLGNNQQKFKFYNDRLVELYEMIQNDCTIVNTKQLGVPLPGVREIKELYLSIKDNLTNIILKMNTFNNMISFPSLPNGQIHKQHKSEIDEWIKNLFINLNNQYENIKINCDNEVKKILECDNIARMNFDFFQEFNTLFIHINAIKDNNLDKIAPSILFQSVTEYIISIIDKFKNYSRNNLEELNAIHNTIKQSQNDVNNDIQLREKFVIPLYYQLIKLQIYSDNLLFLEELIRTYVEQYLISLKSSSEKGRKILGMLSDMLERNEKDIDSSGVGRTIMETYSCFKQMLDLLFFNLTVAQDIDYVVNNLKTNEKEGNLYNKEEIKKYYRTCQRIIDETVLAHKSGSVDDLQAIVDDIRKTTKYFKPDGIHREQNTLPEVIARGQIDELAVADEAGRVQAEFYKKPHPVQVVAIFQMLGLNGNTTVARNLLRGNTDIPKPVLEFVSKNPLTNHLVQVLTGEGKSVVQAITAIIFAMFGYKVNCACYSSLLTRRDYDSFSPLFKLLGVEKQIYYDTFNNLCESIIKEDGDVREMVRNIIFPTNNNTGLPVTKAEKLPRVLLIDEVDVFFKEDFYGELYVSTLKLEGIEQIGNLTDLIWKRRKDNDLNIGSIKTTQEYKDVCQVFNNQLITLINEVVKDMICHAQTFDKIPYEIKNDMIGYKQHDEVVTDITYGYRTLFSYYHAYEQGRITQTSLNNFKKIQLKCGRFSYAEIPTEKYFKYIMGVTGTLKLTPYEMNILQSEFKIKRFSYMPSAYGASKLNKPKDGKRKVSDSNYIHVVNDDQYYNMICLQIKNNLVGNNNTNSRAVLVLFENAELIEKFQESSEFIEQFDIAIRTKVNIIKEIMDESEKKTNIRRATNTGRITFMTKAFGRGVDFYCKDEVVNNNDGTAVIQTFLSENLSEEIQVRGRTARQGQHGSFHLILKRENLEVYLISPVDLEGLTADELMNYSSNPTPEALPTTWLNKIKVDLQDLEGVTTEKLNTYRNNATKAAWLNKIRVTPEELEILDDNDRKAIILNNAAMLILESLLGSKRDKYYETTYGNNRSDVIKASEKHKESIKFLDALLTNTNNKNQVLIEKFLLDLNKSEQTFVMSNTGTLVLLDATVSMKHAMNNAKNKIEEMFTRAYTILEDNGLSKDAVSMQFGVYRNYNSNNNDIFLVSPWENNAENLKSFLKPINVDGGWGNEAVEVGIWHAANEAIKGLVSQVILIGDAAANTPKDIESKRAYIFTQNKFGGNVYWNKSKYANVKHVDEELKRLITPNGDKIPVHTFYINAQDPEQFGKVQASFSDISNKTGGTSSLLDVNSANGGELLTNSITRAILKNIGGDKLVTQYNIKFAPEH
eukprot:gene10155-13661_t